MRLSQNKETAMRSMQDMIKTEQKQKKGGPFGLW
jgi:hypothetical protein